MQSDERYDLVLKIETDAINASLIHCVTLLNIHAQTTMRGDIVISEGSHELRVSQVAQPHDPTRTGSGS
jgi:hypothetical protein